MNSTDLVDRASNSRPEGSSWNLPTLVGSSFASANSFITATTARRKPAASNSCALAPRGARDGDQDDAADVIGIAYGWIGPTVDAFMGQNKALAEILAAAGGANLTDSYFAASFRLIALLATGFAIQSFLRLRSEEASMRAESVLATPVSRWRWGASHLTVAFAGSVILLGVASSPDSSVRSSISPVGFRTFRRSSACPSCRLRA
jgi:hypothetical protein